jgi:hypothetical protein
MRKTIRFVNSIQNLDPKLFRGQILVTPDGSFYEVQAGDELGGIGDFFKKLGAIALPLAGAVAAPFTGGASLALIGAAGSITGGLLGSSLAAGAGNQAKGLAAIQAKGAEVIAAFDLLKQKISSDATFQKSDAYSAADKLVSILSNPAEFYQAKSGKDAAALADFKLQAAQLAAQTKTFADAADAQKQQTVAAMPKTGASGQTVTRTVDASGRVTETISQPASSLPFGLSFPELAIGAAAFYFLFMRA